MEAQKFNRMLNQLGLFSTWGYIFFSIVPHAAAGKYIASGFMLVAFLGLLVRRQIKKPELNWLNMSVFLVVSLALLSAVLTPYAADSLNQFRKEGLPFLLGFLLLLNVTPSDRPRTAAYTVLALIAGYAVKECLALWAGVNNNFQFSIYETADNQLPKYLDFFSADTPYYLPFLLAPLCFWPMQLWQRLVLLVLTVLAIAVVVVAGVRTAFIFVLLSTAFILVYRFWAFKKTVFGILMALTLGTYLLKDHITNPSIARYASIASTQTYQFGKDGSVSERYAIIKGVWEVSRDRLLLGYGPGWKKLPTVAEANGHMARWRHSPEAIDKVALNYFSYGEGRVNPHNFYMAVLFEEGLLGLLAYLSLMLAAAVGVLKMLVTNRDPVKKGIAVASVVYLMVYFGGSLAGGAWLPVSMLVMTVCLALTQSKNPAHNRDA